MKLARRTRFVPPATGGRAEAVGGRPARSLRRRFLLPFAVGVALLGVAVGVAAAWGAWAAAQEELRNRADTSVRVFREALVSQQARLEREAFQLAVTPGVAEAIAQASSEDLAGLGVSNTLSNRFDYVAISGPRGGHVYSDRNSDWGVLRDPALLDSAAFGVTEGGLAVTGDGTPVVFAAVPVRIPGPRNGVIVVGEPVKPVNLEEIVRPLSLTFELRTSRGGSVNSLAGATDHRPSVRTFVYPAETSRFSAGQATLRVGLSTTPLHRATVSAAVTAAVVACVAALSLLLFVALLLDRAVLRPLRRLRAGIASVEEGRYEVNLPLDGVREFADVAAGFQRMAAMVGEQQACLRDQAARDPLTGLANHASFHAALQDAAERAQHRGERLAVLVLDIDHFKEINDAYGHPFGDEVLRTVGRHLIEAIRETDVAARLGGDEFAVLLSSSDQTRAGEVAERICRDLHQVSVGEDRLSVSVGLACFPADARDAASLVEVADQALYAAKRGGRGRAHAYQDVSALEVESGTSDTASSERRRVLDLLALPEPVVPVFQPVVDMDVGTVMGYEALARFPSDAGSPETWFARAHRCGLGSALEARAISAALAAPDRPAGFLALNVSPSALLSADVDAALPASLADVVLEITEHEPVFDPQALCDKLDVLRKRGARIALDDTGSGYAGLQQLLTVRPELIKLDRCLVNGIDSDVERQAMIQALVRFAQGSGALICAEGVETLEQASALVGLGVVLGQGFGLARPDLAWASLSDTVTTALRSTPERSRSERADNADPDDSLLPLTALTA